MTAPAEMPDKPVAVALTYARDSEEAPRVVAKGHGEIAAAIEKLAKAHGIPIRKDASLASLLAAVELDSFIPVEAYVAVAQILSYIYQRPDAGGGQKPR